MSHIVITGGNGFLGRHIARLASEQGIKVISISRSGKPEDLGAGYDHVQWVAADVFDAATWEEHLQGCIALIHSIGTYEENQAKGITHERMNYQSSVVAGEAAQQAGVPKFVYISAAGGGPGAADSYTASKRKAEQALQAMHFSLAILRPSLMYGEENPASMEWYRSMMKEMEDPAKREKMYPSRPLPVATVAAVAVQCAVNTQMTGVLNVDDIDKLANT